ncbi:bifunctional arginine demethylase and lysyl-hydroxylase JMJD6-B [Diachasma alloeum]|uniref:bifunctional arginine demethylase and lysyl-hydroxylase JMJD6-B n=1 Tax=Diachasma alloeum TaxID=454923 RepID=UPI0007384514|nr:bifunctional arginine demethylase and lysyl-hydroxylase JMJD6-B [Diachasma alloeum]
MTDKPERVAEHQRKQMETAKKELQVILKKIEVRGLIPRCFGLWRASSLLCAPTKFRLSGRHLLGLGILCYISYYFTNDYFLSHRHQKCLVETPTVFQRIFRPAEDCSVCHDVQQVEKLANVEPEVFEERYAYSGRPVVITDATSNWSATRVFSFGFFKSLYQDQDANCQFFPYKTDFRSLREVFNMTEDRARLRPGSQPWYVGWSNCDEKIGTILRQHYHRPYFLPPLAESEKTDWIFMGSSGYGAPMHVDDVEHASWQAQIKGSKLWILEPPRECHYTCARVEVVVEPGEIIILDTNRWYHQTRIISEDLSITIGAEYD